MKNWVSYLIHADELPAAQAVVDHHPSHDELAQEHSYILPLLSNYSSDYLCVAGDGGHEQIFRLDHDDPDAWERHASSLRFLDTLVQCYRRQVYFLDADGYLDYDFDREQQVRAELNS